ncbi:MAG: methionine--tRNA ligase [bacterium]
MSKNFYITTPIYYVNDVPHIGHAYTTVAADVTSRYRRMMGDRVFFLTGTDEHGQKVEKTAAAQGITPSELADRVVVRFRDLWKKLNISNQDFIRTTEPRHHNAVQALWKTVAEKGDIYQGEYEDWYCTPCETFLTELQLTGGKCPDCGRQPERLKEESYFFRMSRYGEKLLKHIEEHPDFIQPTSRRNEIVQFVRGGLKDLSISRTTFSWGIPVPGNSRHVVYVWFDALVNYLSALGYPGDQESFRAFWPADIHVIGKDILRFHAVYWPAFLMAADLPLPKQIFSHGWWTLKGEKMSKSKGNVVDPSAMVERYGADPFRYFLLREVPFGQDGDFSESALVGRFNSDLANDLGNLFSRVTAMLAKYCGGKTPAPSHEGKLKEKAEAVIRDVDRYMADLAFSRALQEIWGLINAANRFVDQQAPWALAKDPAQAGTLEHVMYDLVETLRIVTLLITPFMPDTGEKAASILGLAQGWCQRDLLSWGKTPEGRRISVAEPLFPRVEQTVPAEKTESQGRKKKTERPESEHNAAEEITIQDFARMDLRAGVIREAEAVPKSDRLIRLQVDIGGAEPRQVVAGIAQSYAPSDLVGKGVVVLANLKPTRLMGVESCGMVLAVEGEKGLVLLNMDGPVVPGKRVR